MSTKQFQNETGNWNFLAVPFRPPMGTAKPVPSSVTRTPLGGSIPVTVITRTRKDDTKYSPPVTKQCANRRSIVNGSRSFDQMTPSVRPRV